MTVRVLIVSPDTGFGGLIQQTLEKSGRYKPVLVSTGRQALELTKQIPIELAILDADTADLSINEMGEALHAHVPELRLLLIPTGETKSIDEAGGLSVNGYLTKPFYLPDLVDIVDNALTPAPGEAAAETMLLEDSSWEDIGPTLDDFETSSDYPFTDTLDDAAWLGDINLAAQHLARLSLSTSSQAALILRGGRLWAYAGELTQQAAEELAQIVQHGWKPGAADDRGGDERVIELAHFAHLESTGSEYLLYATNIENDMHLVLAFDARTPFSEIRTQANSLAKALSSSPEAEIQEYGVPYGAEIDDVATADSAALSMNGEIPANASEMDWALEFNPGLEAVEDGDIDEYNIANVGSAAIPAMAEEPAWQTAIPDRIIQQGSVGSAVVDKIALHSETDQEQIQPVRINKTSMTKSPTGSATLYDLHYACILVPRLPEHHLTGDLSAKLPLWIRRLSLAYGWRLEYLALRPGWLQWIAEVEPETSAEQVVQFIRRATSDLIFSEFPRYAAENPSQDFWAPGYLVMTSTKPLAGDIVQGFIERTRVKQGISSES